MQYVSLLDHEGKTYKYAKKGRGYIYDHHLAFIVRLFLESGAWYSKGKYNYDDKDSNSSQGIVVVGGFVSAYRYLCIEL